ARRVAEALRDDLLAAKLNVKLVNAGDYKFKQIASEKLLIGVWVNCFALQEPFVPANVPTDFWHRAGW
ncbi:hypothetical protein H3284_23335, partial [Escherichia coli]|nr:hypothetical protein [Escherichia coli]